MAVAFLEFTATRVADSSSTNASQLFIGTHNESLAAIAAIMVSIVRSIGGYKPPFPIPQTQSAFHRRAQRNAFRRRDVRQQIDVIKGSCIQTARRIIVLIGDGPFCVNALLAVSFEHFFIRTSTFEPI